MQNDGRCGENTAKSGFIEIILMISIFGGFGYAQPPKMDFLVLLNYQLTNFLGFGLQRL